MESTFQKQYFAFSKAGLNPTEVCILTNIYNRYQLSCTHSNFFDNQENDYYVIYTYDELAKDLNISISTVKREFKKLVKLNWLSIKRAFNRVNLIFIPQCKKPETCKPNSTSLTVCIDEEVKMTPSTSSNWSTRKIKNINNNTLRYNSDSPKVIDHQNYDSKFKNPKQKQDYNFEESSKNSIISAMINQGISKQAALTIKAWTQDSDQMQNVKNLIYIAKKQAIQNAEQQGNFIDLTFENSNFPTQDFNQMIDVVMPKANRNAHNFKSYIFTSFLNFFEKTINKILKNHQAQSQSVLLSNKDGQCQIVKKLSKLGEQIWENQENSQTLVLNPAIPLTKWN